MNAKALIAAPCGIMNAKGKTEYPCVDCEETGCATCGWNPVEKARRLKTGKWRPITSRINAETGEEIQFPARPEQLIFRKGNS